MNQRSRWANRLAIMPIPVLVLAIVALWVADVRVVWLSPPLNWLVHYGSAILGLMLIVIPAAHSFVVNRQPSVLMLGCGMLMTQIGAGAMLLVSAQSLDPGFAIYNTSALLSALCHFTGVAITSRRKIRLRRSALWLTAAYAGSMAVMGLLIWAALAGRMPVFYIEGQGGTLLRSLVVSAAVAFFLLTAGLLWQTNRRVASPFLFWYALGLVLLAAGLAGSMAIAMRDSPLQWVTRSTQVLGLVYMCIAVLASARKSRAKGIPLAAVEEAWRESTFLVGLRQQTPLGWVASYGLAVVAVAAGFALRQALTAWVGPGLPAYITFYPVVMVVALLAGFGPALLATALAGLAAAYWILPPEGFAIASPVDRLGLVIFAGMGLFMSAVAELYQRNRNKAVAYDREAALRESRSRLATFAEATFEGIVESEAGRIVDCNVICGRFDPSKPFFTARGSFWTNCTTELLASTTEADRQARTRNRCNGQGYESVALLPLHVGNERLGLLQLNDRRKDRFTAEGIALWERLAGYLAVALAKTLAEEALARDRNLLRTLIDNLPDCVFVKDTQCRFLAANLAITRLMGATTPSALLGKSDADFYPPEQVAQYRADEEELLRSGQALVDKDEPHRDANGNLLDVLTTKVPITDGQGKIVGLVGITRDITERKQAEEELKAAKDSAEQAKASAELANRAKDHFLAVLSHELRTPLTPVVMGISMLQGRPDLDPQAREMLEMVRRNVEMEARLIDDLLDVSRITRGKLELTRSPVELCTVISRAVEVCNPDIEARRLHFGLDMGPSAPYWVDADVPRLQQVFWNLLKNAIKFTPHGGRVGVRCRPEAGHVVVEVNDSGIGIKAAALARVFNAFEQAERSITRQFGGLGLGLAISKALVEMHGGTIEAHSEGLNKGATFLVRLPLTVPAGQPEAPAPATTLERAVCSLHILLAEDHGVTAKMMQMVLTEAGHTVETAGDVATALQLAGQQRFDLLLSDLGLPDGSGHDLMRELRSRGHTFPAIALSGYGQEDDIRRSHETGFAAHLTKPASREAVVAAVAAVAAGKLAATKT